MESHAATSSWSTVAHEREVSTTTRRRNWQSYCSHANKRNRELERTMNAWYLKSSAPRAGFNRLRFQRQGTMPVAMCSNSLWAATVFTCHSPQPTHMGGPQTHLVLSCGPRRQTTSAVVAFDLNSQLVAGVERSYGICTAEGVKGGDWRLRKTGAVVSGDGGSWLCDDRDGGG